MFCFVVGNLTNGLGALLCFGAAFASHGCLFYDSRWGQASASQHRVAAQATPHLARSSESRESAPSGLNAPPVRTLSLHVLATPHYASALVNWRHQFENTLADANATLRRDFGIELSVTDYRVWTQMESDDSLEQLLRALREFDPGEDADWVIGLASATPALTDSPDRIGLGVTPGKHLVTRAMSDVAEFDAIEREFTELTDAERRKLYAARKRHKSAWVLLHELGHTLGMQHETGNDSAMNPRYNAHADDFSLAAIAFGRQALAKRLDAVVAAKASPAEPQALQAKVQPTASLAPAPSAKLAELSDSDQRLFDRALALEQQGKHAPARELAAPLFSAYPRLYAVQDLRCRLALALRGGYDDVVSAECEALSALPKSRAH